MDLSQLTNDKLRKKYHGRLNQFELVNFAISRAREMITSGREPLLSVHSQNRALLILEEIVTDVPLLSRADSTAGEKGAALQHNGREGEDDKPAVEKKPSPKVSNELKRARKILN